MKLANTSFHAWAFTWGISFKWDLSCNLHSILFVILFQFCKRAPIFKEKL